MQWPWTRAQCKCATTCYKVRRITITYWTSTQHSGPLLAVCCVFIKIHFIPSLLSASLKCSHAFLLYCWFFLIVFIAFLVSHHAFFSLYFSFPLCIQLFLIMSPHSFPFFAQPPSLTFSASHLLPPPPLFLYCFLSEPLCSFCPSVLLRSLTSSVSVLWWQRCRQKERRLLS